MQNKCLKLTVLKEFGIAKEFGVLINLKKLLSIILTKEFNFTLF